MDETRRGQRALGIVEGYYVTVGDNNWWVSRENVKAGLVVLWCLLKS